MPMFLRVDCHLSYSFANDVFFLKLEVFWLNIFNTNSIQLAPSDIFAWYESFVLPEIEFKSEVLNHQLFTQLSLLVLFNFVATKNILPLSKPRENMENLRLGRSLSLPKRWQRRPIFWAQPPEQVWRQGLWGLQGNLSIKFSEANKGDIRERHVAVITSLSPKSEVTCALFPSDACYMK